MKTFLVVTLYIAMVAALDLGGAVWTGLHAAHPVKGTTVHASMAITPVKTQGAIRVVGTIPSHT